MKGLKIHGLQKVLKDMVNASFKKKRLFNINL